MFKKKSSKNLRTNKKHVKNMCFSKKIVKKHQKPNPQANIKGGIIEKESSIHISNIAIYNKKTKKADRVKIEVTEKLKKRIFKSDGKEIK